MKRRIFHYAAAMSLLFSISLIFTGCPPGTKTLTANAQPGSGRDTTISKERLQQLLDKEFRLDGIDSASH